MKLTKTQKNKINKIAEKYDLKLIILFGSFALGKERSDSDIDIGVLSNKEVEFEKTLSLIGDFGDVFKREPDLSILNHANPLWLNEVSRNAQLLFGRKSDFIKFKLYAFHRFNDYAPYFALEKKVNLRLIKELC